MHPDFVLAYLQLREIKIFCEDCKLVTPPGFFRGFAPHFCVHLLGHSHFLCSFFHCQHFGFFFTLIAFNKKGNAVPMQIGVTFV